jgi:hypothetical protein
MPAIRMRLAAAQRKLPAHEERVHRPTSNSWRLIITSMTSQKTYPGTSGSNVARKPVSWGLLSVGFSTADSYMRTVKLGRCPMVPSNVGPRDAELCSNRQLRERPVLGGARPATAFPFKLGISKCRPRLRGDCLVTSMAVNQCREVRWRIGLEPMGVGLFVLVSLHRAPKSRRHSPHSHNVEPGLRFDELGRIFA